MITLILADDHPVTRAGIRAILSEATDINIVGEAKDGFEAEKLVEQFNPRILLLDLKMPGPRPAEIEKRVRTHFPDTMTLILTAHDRDCYLTELIDAGVSGYLDKKEAGERLIEAIRRAAQGENIISNQQYSRAQKWRLEAGNKVESLTKREREVLKLMCQGLSNPTIAKTLHVSRRDIVFHVTNILGKLEVNTRQEAVAWLYKYFPDGPE
jgi:NarL family two-component system response regulator LiaR